jgi:hypothetical protein
MKRLITNYSFNAASKTVTFTEIPTIQLDRILIISNVTDQILIYNFADTSLGGTVATNVLTLEYDTTSMSNTDDLLIYYDEDLISRIDDFTSTTVIYFGWASPGASTASAIWKITRFTISTGAEESADGNSTFDNIWDNRASLSYS